jgi:hypothetical protein
MGLAVEVEADRGGVRAARADDGEGFGGFGAGDEEPGCGEGAGDVDDFAGEGGERAGLVLVGWPFVVILDDVLV